MKYERSGATSINHEDKIYVFGGQHEGLHALNVNEIFSLDSTVNETKPSIEIGDSQLE